MAAQKPPDILDVNIAQSLGLQSEPVQRANPCGGGLSSSFRIRLSMAFIDRLLAGSRLVLQPFKAMVGIAMPSKADNPRLDPPITLTTRPDLLIGEILSRKSHL